VLLFLVQEQMHVIWHASIFSDIYDSIFPRYLIDRHSSGQIAEHNTFGVIRKIQELLKVTSIIIVEKDYPLIYTTRIHVVIFTHSKVELSLHVHMVT